MVSFQCDGCQDVVKKPKLDSHGARCHASFTCIDCSKTFAGPAQWKSHTSCISEVQKYQKSVYQEPRGRGRGRGQRGRGGARGGFARAAYNGSGENSIPLGSQTNAWTAPPPDPVNNAPFDSSEWKATTEDVATSTSAPEVNSPESGSKGVEEPKKSKKRKTEDSEATELTGATTTSDGPAKKKKKNKSHDTEPEITHDRKEKRRKPKGAIDQDDDVAMAEAAAPPANGKEKKSKKSRRSEGLVNEEPTITSTPALTHEESSTPLGNESGKKKKSRKPKASEEPSTSTEQSSNIGPVANGHSTEKKRKSKGSNSDNALSVPIANDPAPVSVVDGEAHLTKKERQKKAKKDKKEQAEAEARAKDETVESAGSTLQNGAESVGEDANGNEVPLKSKKSKKDKKDKKNKKGNASAVNGIQPMDELEATNGEVPKSKKKSKREKKSDAVEAS